MSVKEKTSTGQQEKSWSEQINEAAENISGKAEKAFEQLEEKAEKLWEITEAKVEVLVDKIKSSEFEDQAKEKLNDLAKGAQSLWNKMVDKFDGGQNKKNE